VQPLGRAAEVELFGDRDEVLDEPEIEAFDRRSLLIGGQLVLDFSARQMDPWHAGETGRGTRSRRRSCLR
jgi:hypothetical protein